MLLARCLAAISRKTDVTVSFIATLKKSIYTCFSTYGQNSSWRFFVGMYVIDVTILPVRRFLLGLHTRKDKSCIYGCRVQYGRVYNYLTLLLCNNALSQWLKNVPLNFQWLLFGGLFFLSCSLFFVSGVALFEVVL